MNDQANKVLSQMLKQFEQRHNRKPLRIVVTPLAVLALTIKRSLAPTWEGIPVESRELKETEATDLPSEAKGLAVFVLPEDRTARLVACDIKL